jgi:hypothetical protein
VHPLEDAAVDQLAQVTSHGLLGDGEVRRQGAHLDAAVGPGSHQDLALPFVRLHRATSCPNLCDVGHVSSLHEGTGIAEPGWAEIRDRFMWGALTDM